MEKSEIKTLFDRFGASISSDDVWNVQSATVIKHKALERLAASAGIEFDKPQVLRAERDEAVVLVSGRLGDRSEWSIGEALVNVNYRVSGKQAAYVYAMAEKRAKDRVIIKLAGLHGLYSEDEADEFNEVRQSAQQQSPTDGKPQQSPTEWFIANINKASDAAAIFEWFSKPKIAEAFEKLSDTEKAHVKQAEQARLNSFNKETA